MRPCLSIGPICACLMACVQATLAAGLTIISVPDGANVHLDEQFIGTTPVTVDRAEAGTHLLRVEKKGFLAFRKVVEVGADGVTVTAELVGAATGTLVVTSTPDRADVVVDGEPMGQTPLTLSDLTLTLHSVQITRDGYEAWSGDVDLSETPQAQVEATLEARIADYLIAEIAAHPDVINNYADLAHHYVLTHGFDRAFQVLDQGLDAVARFEDRAQPDEIRRLTDELERVYTAQYDYADPATVAALQPRVLATYDGAIARNPTCGSLYIALGDLHVNLGNVDVATSLFDRGVTQAVGLVSQIRLQGRLGARLMAQAKPHDDAQEWDAALAIYRSLIEKMPKHYQTLEARERIIAIRVQRDNDFPGAIEELRAILENHPSPFTDPGYLQRIAAYQQKIEDFAGAEATCEQIAGYGKATDVQAALNQAASLRWNQLKDPDGALALYTRCVELGMGTSSGSLAQKYRADILRSKSDVDAANALTAELCEKYPGSLGAYYTEMREDQKQRNQAASTLYQEAAQLAKDGKVDEAIAKYHEAADQYPETYHGQASLSQVISTLGSVKKDWAATIEARKLFMQRYPDDPDTPSQLWYIGYIQQSQLSDKAAAETAWREFLDKYPDDPMASQVCYHLGSLLYGTQTEFAKALEVFRMLVDKYPDSQYYPHGLYYGGECLMSMLQVDQAREMWRELIDKMPNSSLAYQAAESSVRIRRREGKGQW